MGIIGLSMRVVYGKQVLIKHLRGTHVIVYGGGDRNNTEGEQTTKKWETDVHAKRYERGRRLGKDN